MGRDDRRAGVGGERPLEHGLGRGGIVEGEDEDRGLLADPERLQPAAQLRRLEQPAEGAGSALIAPAALTLLFMTFGASPKELTKALALYGAAAPAGPVCLPPPAPGRGP